jgi:hypothetical protein
MSILRILNLLIFMCFQYYLFLVFFCVYVFYLVICPHSKLSVCPSRYVSFALFPVPLHMCPFFISCMFLSSFGGFQSLSLSLCLFFSLSLLPLSFCLSFVVSLFLCLLHNTLYSIFFTPRKYLFRVDMLIFFCLIFRTVPFCLLFFLRK